MAFDRSPLIADSLSLSEARGYRDIYTYIYISDRTGVPPLPPGV